MIFDQPGSYGNSQVINEGVTIAAAGVTLTNVSGGRILGSGVTITAGGSTFVNELGAEVGERNDFGHYSSVRVQGSSGADRVINAGLIFGQVRLGDGDDVFVDRNGAVQGSGWEVYLEGGDDILRIEAGGARDGATFAHGGDGYDTVVVASPDSDPRRAALFGFERLVLESGGNIAGYSGFQTIELTSTRPYTLYNFIDCRNPGADLVLSDGDWVQLARSELRSISGSGQNDIVQLVSGGIYSQAAGVLNSVALGGGNDSFTIDAYNGGVKPTVGGSIDGGEGVDSFGLVVGDGSGSGGTISLDLAQATGFEQLYVNAHYTYLDASVTLSNLAGFQAILVGEMTNLVLSSAALPGAELRGAAGGSVSLASDVVIGSYSAFRYDPMPGSPAITEADLAATVTFVNHGMVTASIRFAGGFDVYDGRQGSVGGTVDGGAGDDRLLGGVGAEHFVGGTGDDLLDGGDGDDRLDGGHGNDRLEGGAGSDVLLGGRGADVLVGGAGSDVYEVDDGGDLVVEQAGHGIDAVFAYADFILADHVENLFMNYGSQAGGTGNAADNIIIGNAAANIIEGRGGRDSIGGGDGNDRLDGGAGNDTLAGGAGADVLLGGAGADLMTGGAGSDIYEVDSVDDIVTELAGEGIADNVFAYVDFALADDLENLLMNYGVQTYGFGNGGNNIIVGNDQANIVEGRAGYDTLTGGGGSDLFIISPQFGVDVITDFVAGAGTNDALIFSRSLFTSFDAVLANSAQVGADTWIGDGLGNTVVLAGVRLGDLHADDFGFF